MDKDNALSEEKFLSSTVRPVNGSRAYRRYPRGAQKCYKPISTRIPFLFAVLVVALALIALVEVACRRYPVQNNPDGLWGFNFTRRALVEERKDETGQRYHLPLAERKVNISSSAGYAPKSAYLPETTASTTEVHPIYTPNPGAYLPTSSTAVDHVSLPGTLGQDSYLPTIQFPSTTNQDAYIPTSVPGSGGTITYVPTVTNGDAYLPTTVYYSNPDAYLPTTATDSSTPDTTTPEERLPTRTTTPDAYIPTSLVSAGADSYLPTNIFSTGADGYIPTSQPSGPVHQTIAPSSAPTGYLPTDSSKNAPPTSTNNQDAKNPPLVPVSTYTSHGNAVVVMGTPTKTSLVPVSTYTTDGYVMVVMGTPSKTSLVPISTMTSNGVAVVVLGIPTSTPAITGSGVSGSAVSVIVTPVTTTSGGVTYVYMTTMTLGGTKIGPTAPKSTATAAAVNNTCEKLPQGVSFSPLTPFNYFTSSYLLTLLAVGFRVLWTLVYDNARLMEPFYRLVSPAGATGKHFLEILYLSMDDFIPEPLPSLLSGHSYMLLMSTIAFLTELMAPFASEFLTVDTTHGPIFDVKDPNHPCWPQIMVRYLPARILQGILALTALLILLSMYLSWNRPSGVYSNPSSIAVMASLLHHPDVLDDFKTLGTNPSDDEVGRIASDQTYRLAHYQAEGDGMKYGIVPVLQMSRSPTGNQNAYSAVANLENRVQHQRRRLYFQGYFWRTLGDVLLGVLSLGVLGVVLAYYLDGKDDGFNRFFNSQTFGPRFILVLAGGVIVSQWKRLEREVRTLQTYRQLSSHSSSGPSHTILLITTSTPWTTFPIALVHREFFTGLIAFCYLLSEILVIVLATVPFSATEYWVAYLAGTYISFSILGLQILSFIALVTWWRRTGPRLERDPDTLLGVWALLANSGIRQDFEDLGTAGRKDLVNNVKGWARGIGLDRWRAVMGGEDGNTR